MEAAADHGRCASECLAEHLLLAEGLGDKGVRASKTMTKEESFRGSNEGSVAHAVRVMRHREDEATSVSPAPVTDEAGVISCTALIIDVRVGSAHGTP
jgi:hypothetical protein